MNSTPPPFGDPHATAADPDVVVDLSTPRTVHVVGVGGAAMRAIAAVLARMGHRVSGSDLRDSPTHERLRIEGIDVVVGHDAANVPADADLLAVSTAIPSRRSPRAIASASGTSSSTTSTRIA